jgi:hypothetical protein
MDAITTPAVDSLSLILDRIVSVCVEWEEESILILFVTTSSRVPGDTSEAPASSPCLCNLHQWHGRSAVVDSAVDTLVGPFFAISSPVQQFERNHRFFHAAGNDVKDKFLILSWCHFWAPCSFRMLACLRLNLRICFRSRLDGFYLDRRVNYCSFLRFF